MGRLFQNVIEHGMKSAKSYRRPLRLCKTEETLLHFQRRCFRKCDDQNAGRINALLHDEM